MANLDVALQAIVNALAPVLTAANLTADPGQVFVGWPTAAELHEVAHQPGAGSQVSVWPLDVGGASEARYHDTTQIVTPPAPGTTATLDETLQIVTFGGTPTAGDVVHAFFGHPLSDAFYKVNAGDTAATISTEIAAAVDALAVPGVSATASGDATTLTGAFFQRVNVGGTGTLMREINRIKGMVQVSIWAPNGAARSLIGEAILATIGGTNQPFLPMPDGTALRIAYSHPKWWDKGQQSYSVYRWDLIFEVEYGITQTLPGTQVEGTALTVTLDNDSPTTVVSGGSS